MTAAAGTTLYLSESPGSALQAEKFTGTGGLVVWTHYLFAAGELVALRIERSDAVTYTRYVHKDHLGSVSVSVITDAADQQVRQARAIATFSTPSTAVALASWTTTSSTSRRL